MESFSEKIKNLRRAKDLPLRVVAAYLDIDQAILSKIENGKRKASRENVIKLANYFKLQPEELLVSWLSEKLLYEIGDEEVGLKAIKAAEEEILYRTKPSLSKEKIIKKIRDFLKNDGRVSRAWIFGSFARSNYDNKSDIDLMVNYSEKASGTLLDYADIKFQLEKLTGRKVDLVEEGYIKPFAAKSIENDKILIYGSK
ncbi:MAG: nucleotidyltransferase domain-containing protein [Bacteroidales bacterium]|nr:nucleotidyltransferase domain-containing protein [Bacteroidales bacterium]